MKLFLVRHGDADAEIPEGLGDEGRALTAKARQLVFAHFAGLAERMKDTHLVLTSPLVRAVQTAHNAVTTNRPTKSGSITFYSGGVFAVNTDNDSLTKMDGTTRVKSWEVGVGDNPTSVAVSNTGNVWVVNHMSDSISVRNSGTGASVATYYLPRGSAPYGVAFSRDGNNAYVTLQASGRLLRMNPSTGAITGDISVGSTTDPDDTPPSMGQPPNITVNANIGSSGTVRVYYAVPTASESNVDLPVRCTPPPGSLFGVGATTVTCRATDENGNVRERTFTVTVVLMNGRWPAGHPPVPVRVSSTRVGVIGT